MAFKKCRTTIKKKEKSCDKSRRNLTKIIFKSKLKIGERWLRLVMKQNNRIPSD
jgi:uncharacterized protein Yka (UPF0111/DUF47 family)